MLQTLKHKTDLGLVPNIFNGGRYNVVWFKSCFRFFAKEQSYGKEHL